MRVLSIITSALLLLFLGACGTTNPYGLQPNTWTKVKPPAECNYEGNFEHICNVFHNLAIATPENPEIIVTWDYLPGNEYRGQAQRSNCTIIVRDPLQLVAPVYKCLGVERAGYDFMVSFSVQTEKGSQEMVLNLSDLKGDFREGGFYENPFNLGGFLTYGSYSSTTIRIVWATHRPHHWR